MESQVRTFFTVFLCSVIFCSFLFCFYSSLVRQTVFFEIWKKEIVKFISYEKNEEEKLER